MLISCSGHSNREAKRIWLSTVAEYIDLDLNHDLDDNDEDTEEVEDQFVRSE